MLIVKGKNGDRQALGELLGRYQDRIFSYLKKMLNNHHDAEEAAQETFVNAIRALKKYEEQGQFKSWIYRIAYREGLRKLRTRQSHIQDSAAEPEDFSQSPDELVFARERMKEIETAIEHLPVMEKQVVLLRAYSGLQFKEIAEIMDTPLNTALGRMRKASLRLKKILNTNIAL